MAGVRARRGADYAPAIRYRLRDLDRRQRVVAALLALLLVAPFVASAARAVDSDWFPSGDDALIGLRAYDVFSSDAPLTGQPSTSHHYDPKNATAHPGPIEFYAMAIPVRAFGPQLGMLIPITLINASAILLSAWVILRRAGPRVAMWGAVVLSGIAWAQGSFELSDPISSNAGGISLVALAILAWAIVDGDVRLLPVTAFIASWVVQQHLAIVTPAASLALWAGIGVAVMLWRRYDSGRARRRTGGAVRAEVDGDGPGPEPVPARSPTVIASVPDTAPIPWIAGAVGVLLLCSLPMLIEQFGPSGNMASIVSFARESDRATLGYDAGAWQALRAFSIPPMLLRSDYTGYELFAPISLPTAAGGIAVLVALVAVVVVARKRRPALAALATTALVLAAAGLFAGSKIPESIESGRINFYRWTFVVAVCTWIALGWAAALLVRRYRPAVPPLLRRAAPVAAVAVMAVAAVAASTGTGPDDQRRDEAGRQPITAMGDEMVRLARGHDRVTVLLSGGTATASIGPAVVLRLVGEGHEVSVPNVEERFWGANREFDADEDPGLILQLVTRHGPILDGSGRVALRLEFNPELNDMLPNLIEQLTAGEVTVADTSDRTLDGFTTEERMLLQTVVSDMEERPARALMNPTVVKLLQRGLVSEPELDQDELGALLERLPGTQFNGEDTFEVRVITKDELRNSRPELFR